MVDEREGKPEGRAFAFGAVDADLAVVLFYDGAADVEAEAEADGEAWLPGDAFDAVEPVPDALLFGG